jgi:hypothetical protein
MHGHKPRGKRARRPPDDGSTASEGHNSRVVITVIDVTGHRQAEKERERLRKAQVDLAHVAGASFYFTLPTRH